MTRLTSSDSSRAVLFGLLLAPALAFAAVGKVSVLEGQAHRKPGEGAKQKLAVGSEIELNDLITVGKKSNLKLTLTDGSMLMLGEGSELKIDEANFKGQEREGFSATLLIGKAWAKVTKALSGSNAKFEVKTDRAVAGVRGTIFRVDAVKLARAATATGLAKKAQVVTVNVVEGRVAVEAKVKKAAATPRAQNAGEKGKRVLVEGPKEISLEEWEKKFVELQRNQSVTVGLDLWEEAQLRTAYVFEDGFGKFALKNGGGEE
jgi:hypothetical protein